MLIKTQRTGRGNGRIWWISPAETHTRSNQDETHDGDGALVLRKYNKRRKVKTRNFKFWLLMLSKHLPIGFSIQIYPPCDWIGSGTHSRKKNRRYFDLQFNVTLFLVDGWHKELLSMMLLTSSDMKYMIKLRISNRFFAKVNWYSVTVKILKILVFL